MRYGAMNNPLSPLMEEIDAIGNLGFDYLELTLDSPNAHYTAISQQRDEILARLADYEMGLVCHLPTFVYMADLTQSIRRASVEETIRSAEAAAALNAELAVLHPPILNGLGRIAIEMAMDYGYESLSAAVERGKQLGLNLCVENMSPSFGAFSGAEDFDEIFSRFPDLRMTIDIGHANIDGRRGKKAIELIERYADRLGHIHISDNRGRDDDHLPIGAGNIRFPKVLRALKDTGYNKTITLEIFTEDREYLTISQMKIEAMLDRLGPAPAR